MADDKKVTFAEEAEPAPGAGADVEEDEVRSLQARESSAGRTTTRRANIVGSATASSAAGAAPRGSQARAA